MSRRLPLTLLVITLLASTAAAEKRRIIGVLDVRVEGVPKDIATRFQSDLEKQLDSRAYWLAPRSRMHEMLANSTKWTEGCVIGSCLAEVRVQTGAEIVLLAAITGSGTSFSYVVTLVRTDTGRFVGQQSERCDVCTVNEALTSATLAAVTLLTQLPETLPDEEKAHRAELAALDAKHAEAMTRARSKHRKLGIVLTVTGLALAGAGTAVYFVRDRTDAGLITAAGGAGLAVGGIVALTF